MNNSFFALKSKTFSTFLALFIVLFFVTGCEKEDHDDVAEFVGVLTHGEVVAQEGRDVVEPAGGGLGGRLEEPESNRAMPIKSVSVAAAGAVSRPSKASVSLPLKWTRKAQIRRASCRERVWRYV